MRLVKIKRSNDARLRERSEMDESPVFSRWVMYLCMHWCIARGSRIKRKGRRLGQRYFFTLLQMQS